MPKRRVPPAFLFSAAALPPGPCAGRSKSRVPPCRARQGEPRETCSVRIRALFRHSRPVPGADAGADTAAPPRPAGNGPPPRSPGGHKKPGPPCSFIDVQPYPGMAAGKILQQGRTDAPAPQARLHEEHLHPLPHASQKARQPATASGIGHRCRTGREPFVSRSRRAIIPGTSMGSGRQPDQTHALHGRKIDARQGSPDGPQIVLRHEAVRGPHVTPPQAQQGRPVRRPGIAESQSLHLFSLQGSLPLHHACMSKTDKSLDGPTNNFQRRDREHPPALPTGKAAPIRPELRGAVRPPPQGVRSQTPYTRPRQRISSSSSTGYRRWYCPVPYGCPPYCAGSVPVP